MKNQERDRVLAEKLDCLDVPELPPDFYSELRAKIDEERAGRRAYLRRLSAPHNLPMLRGWGVRLAAAVALIALIAGGLWELADPIGGKPSAALINERAFAAVAEQDGILHYIAASWSPPTYNYSEYWATLQGAAPLPRGADGNQRQAFRSDPVRRRQIRGSVTTPQATRSPNPRRAAL